MAEPDAPAAVAPAEPSRAPIAVLESVGSPNERTNPYLPLLVDSLPPHITAHYFTWRRALLGRYDVFHLHWPEVKLRGRTRLRSGARWTLFGLLLLRIRFSHRALVRTLHNAEPHDALGRVPAALVRLADRWTSLWIVLSDESARPPSGPSICIPHGHYRDWFAQHGKSAPADGRLLHVGLLRRYKGVDSLLRAFAELPGDDLSLRIVGATVDHDVSAAVRVACALDPRVTALEDYVPDDALVREVTSAELVVLPFAAASNSGSLLLALSLDRPVLVPSGPMTEKLAVEVGSEWVLTYGGSLTAETLAQALDFVREPRQQSRPNLSEREWTGIGELHAVAFAAAALGARRTPRGT